MGPGTLSCSLAAQGPQGDERNAVGNAQRLSTLSLLPELANRPPHLGPSAEFKFKFGQKRMDIMDINGYLTPTMQIYDSRPQ